MSRERVRLPSERPAITRGFEVPYSNGSTDRFKFYTVVGLYDDGRPAEIFIYTDHKCDQFSSLLAGMLDTIATTISIGLQHAVPLEVYLSKMRHSRFGPSGDTGDAEFPICTSLFDLVSQWLGRTFPDGLYRGGGTPT